jgi:MoaA/NifB/PqqE/SkfB family radical SAM enzyme
MKRWQNTDLNLSDLQNFLDIDLTGKIFNLCGNYGDPIYYDDLFDLISWIKSQAASVIISTNGSYRTDTWWQTLGKLLDHRDTVKFAVDGVPDNFTQYRINANWESIETGMKVLSQTQVQTQWVYIPFSFNLSDIEHAKKISENIGIKKFIVQPSDRWDSVDDPLRPLQFAGRREDAIFSWKENNIPEVSPECTTKHMSHYISANGFYMPCCYVGDYRFYYQSEFYKNRNAYDISKNTITEVVSSLQNFYETLETANHKYCTFNCPKT